MLSSSSNSGVDNAEEPTVFTPHRTSIPSKEHTVLFMPARIVSPPASDTAYAGADRKANVLGGTTIKVVSVPRPDGPSKKGASLTRGLPATTLVLDEDTGSVKAVLNASNLTALRTAAGAPPLIFLHLDLDNRQGHSCPQLLSALQIQHRWLLSVRESRSKRTSFSTSSITRPYGHAPSSRDPRLLPISMNSKRFSNHDPTLLSSSILRTLLRQHQRIIRKKL